MIFHSADCHLEGWSDCWDRHMGIMEAAGKGDYLSQGYIVF